MARDKAPKDDNRVSTLLGVASTTTTVSGVSYTAGITPVPIAVNPVTGAIIVEEA